MVIKMVCLYITLGVKRVYMYMYIAQHIFLRCYYE